mmetsp:Transcript_19808/g.59056  ORF Transcript_19808/g.59056 Transcript_19808/m.59056 type:complete len:203 (+) Transcript_19808:467-1075(+)
MLPLSRRTPGVEVTTPTSSSRTAPCATRRRSCARRRPGTTTPASPLPYHEPGPRARLYLGPFWRPGAPSAGRRPLASYLSARPAIYSKSWPTFCAVRRRPDAVRVERPPPSSRAPRCRSRGRPRPRRGSCRRSPTTSWTRRRAYFDVRGTARCRSRPVLLKTRRGIRVTLVFSPVGGASSHHQKRRRRRAVDPATTTRPRPP